MVQCSKCDSYIFRPRVPVDSDLSEKIFQRLRSPAEATEEEMARADQILQDAESDFASYDAEIARLKTALSFIEHKRQCLQEYVYKHRSLLAPVRRLPPEILSLIFLAHISQSGNTLAYGDFQYGEMSSLVLSQVSIGWRRLALDLPRLWTELEILFCLSTKRGRGHLRYLLSIFLERSVQRPLTVIIDSEGSRTFTDLAIRKIFQPVYSRCRSLTLTSNSVKLFGHESASNSITDFPCLEHLRLPADGLMERWSAVLPVIYEAPRLRHLEITGFSGYFERHGFPYFQQFPWTQINTLSLSFLHVSVLWRFLERCDHLSELTVHNRLMRYHSYHAPADEQELDALPHLTLPHLTNIDIQLDRYEDLGYAVIVLFSKLTAPALKRLTVFVETSNVEGSIRTTWPVSVFDSFAVRSAGSGLFKLSSLRMKFPITASSLLSFLGRLPCLTELEIIEPGQTWDPSERLICDEFLYGLFIGTNTSPFGENHRIPRLLHLCLNMGSYHKPTFKTQTLNEMVKSRWIPDPTCASTIGIACLRSIKVVGDKRTGEKALGYESLRELGRSGLKVEIVPKLV